MNEDIRISTDFPNHRKTQKLYRKLGAEGCFCLVKLWATIANQRPDGNLSGYDKDDIEIDAGWPGEEGAFFDAILKIGFINKSKDGYSVHNWEVRQPWAVRDIVRSEKGRLGNLNRSNKPVGEALKRFGYEQLNKADYQKVCRIGKAENGKLLNLPSKEIESQVAKALNIKTKNSKKPLPGNPKVPQGDPAGNPKVPQGDPTQDPPGTPAKPAAPSPSPSPSLKELHQNSSIESITTTREGNFCPTCGCCCNPDDSNCPNCGEPLEVAS